MRTDADIMACAKRNLALGNAVSQAGLPSHGARWGTYVDRMLAAIDRIGSVSEAIGFAESQCGFDHRRAFGSWLHQGTPKYGRPERMTLALLGKVRTALGRPPGVELPPTMMEVCEALLGYEFPAFLDAIPLFAETEHSLASTVGTFRGRLVSDMLYYRARYILACLTYLPDIGSICEVGGGYGDTARIWMSHPALQAQRYTIIDIPASLFFAEVFLARTLPGVPIISLASPEGVEACKGLDRYVALCPIGMHDLSSQFEFDILINTGSLGEMSESWVDFYSRWADKQNCSTFYSHNYFGNAVENLFEGENLLAPRLTQQWELRSSKINPAIFMLHSGNPKRSTADTFFKRVSDAHGKYGGGDIFRAREHEKFGLEQVLSLCYALYHSDDSQAVVDFVRKSVADLGYFPKELLHMLQVLHGSERFASLGDDAAAYVHSMIGEMGRAYQNGTRALVW